VSWATCAVPRTAGWCAAGLALTVVCVAGLTQFACGKAAAGGGDAGMNPAGPPIIIGASIGITGGLSGNTRALKGAIAVATQEINAAGGILGRQVQFVIQDDKSDPTYVTTAMSNLLGSGVKAVLGPGASSEVSAVMQLLAGSQIVEVSATATSILLTQSQTTQNPGWFFRTVPNDSYQGRAVVRFALQGPNPEGGVAGCRKMAIVYNSDAYGMPMDAIIEPGMTAGGGSIVASISVPATTAASYMTQAQKIVGLQPDCMAMVVFASTGAQLVRDLKTQIAMDTSSHDWSKFFIVGTDGCFDPSFIVDGRQDPNNPSSPSVVEGIYGTNADTAPPTPEYSSLQSLYVTQVGYQADQTDMDPYTSNEYDAAILVALAIQQAGGLNDPLKIRDAMFGVSRGVTSSPTVFGPSQVAEALEAILQGQDINYNGASGNVDFTASGDVVADFIVWQVNGGQFVTHARIPAAQLEN
jgi:ABC-type branched-subunit amino acid transport system substrate-binding protein